MKLRIDEKILLDLNYSYTTIPVIVKDDNYDDILRAFSSAGQNTCLINR